MVRMRFWIAGLLLGTSASLPAAQTQGFRVSLQPEVDARGFSTVVVENVSDQNITAIHLTQRCGEGEARRRSLSSQNFDVALNATVRPTASPAAVGPGEEKSFQIRADAASCPATAAVLFSDGHREGPADGPDGWKAMLARRAAAFDELEETRNFVLSLPRGDIHQALTDNVQSRLAKLPPPRPMAGTSEAAQRRSTLTWILRVMEMPDGQMTEKKGAIATLERWMAPLHDALRAGVYAH